MTSVHENTHFSVVNIASVKKWKIAFLLIFETKQGEPPIGEDSITGGDGAHSCWLVGLLIGRLLGLVCPLIARFRRVDFPLYISGAGGPRTAHVGL